MKDEEKARCGNCMFFSENGDFYAYAFCQRFPPVLVEEYREINADETEHWLQPVVKVSSWCGEWRPIPRGKK